MHKRLLFLVLFMMLLLPQGLYAGQPAISGKGAVLIDANSGQVLVDYNKDEKLPPASTTKILTAIIAIESGKLEDMVVVGPNPPKVDGTKVYLEEGESIKLKELVAAAMIHSTNDAALAIAEYLAGSQEEFAKVMNAKAKELGATNSNFVTPHGLSEDNHYTTAYDLACISRYAMQNELFRQFAASKILDWQGKAWQTRLININKMLWNYDGSDGVKTGYTTEAKSTIVASAERNGQRYIAVVLGSSGSAIWEDASRLLDYGFNNFQQLKLAEAGEIVATIKINKDSKLELVPTRELFLSIPADGSKEIDSYVHLNQIQGKILKGQAMGIQYFTIDGKEAGSVELQAANAVNPGFSFTNIFLYGGAGLFFVQIIWRSTKVFRRKKRRTARLFSENHYRGY